LLRNPSNPLRGGRVAPGAGFAKNVTLGIEICALDNDGTLALCTVAAAAKLTAELCRRYDMPVDRVGTHYLVVGWKDCPRVWTRFPEQFEEFKEAGRRADIAAFVRDSGSWDRLGFAVKRQYR
jgi:hypothetical protein